MPFVDVKIPCGERIDLTSSYKLCFVELHVCISFKYLSAYATACALQTVSVDGLCIL